MKKLNDERRVKREVHEREEELRQQQYLKEQVERARQHAVVQAAGGENGEHTLLERDQLEGPVVLSLKASAAAGTAAASAAAAAGTGEAGRAAGFKRPLPVLQNAFAAGRLRSRTLFCVLSRLLWAVCRAVRVVGTGQECWRALQLCASAACRRRRAEHFRSRAAAQEDEQGRGADAEGLASKEQAGGGG